MAFEDTGQARFKVWSGKGGKAVRERGSENGNERILGHQVPAFTTVLFATTKFALAHGHHVQTLSKLHPSINGRHRVEAGEELLKFHRRYAQRSRSTAYLLFLFPSSLYLVLSATSGQGVRQDARRHAAVGGGGEGRTEPAGFSHALACSPGSPSTHSAKLMVNSAQEGGHHRE